MIILSGVDLASVAEVNALAADSFTRDRIWTVREQKSHADYPERRAGQWAAKEAVMKVLGAGVGTINLQDIEIVGPEGERPTAVLSGSALELCHRLGISSVSISITHELGAAVAVAVALADEGGRTDDN